MRIRDKSITAVCLFPEGIEWTSLKIKQGKTERQERKSLPFSETQQEGVTMATVVLPENLAGKVEGDITVSIRTSELIMRTIEVPSSDPDEVASMVSFQIDKIAPYPMDQMAISHEILRETENGALVLMAAAKRTCIDAIGETFKKRDIHIHSIDASVLGWLQLLKKGGHILETGTQILVIRDGIDFALAVLLDGIPLSIHSLDSTVNSENLCEALAEEIKYTMVALDAEHDLPSPQSIDFWSVTELPPATTACLQQRVGLKPNIYSLAELPPLSEGIAERSRDKANRIELIPTEWIEHEKNKQLKKQVITASSIIVGVWICALAILLTLFKMRDNDYSELKSKEEGYYKKATVARQDKLKLEKLKAKMDQKNSALEGLREIVVLWPGEGEISDLTRFNYEKKKGEVQVRGSTDSVGSVDTFFNNLTKSELFVNIANQNSSTRNVRTGRETTVMTEFSVTLLMDQEGK
ncbi:MAG: hypothetical protein GXY61_04720 [Lentisphaerae bacterium]|jgi:hypothetical protein|nr:hypothetical protein [Lentisphaerota bacterium]